MDTSQTPVVPIQRIPVTFLPVSAGFRASGCNHRNPAVSSGAIRTTIAIYRLPRYIMRCIRGRIRFDKLRDTTAPHIPLLFIRISCPFLPLLLFFVILIFGGGSPFSPHPSLCLRDERGCIDRGFDATRSDVSGLTNNWAAANLYPRVCALF